MKGLVIIIEDSRGVRTWQTLINIVSSCACRHARQVEEIRPLRGPLEGSRLCKTVKALQLRHPGATIVASLDTDRYRGVEVEAERRLLGELRRHCPKEAPRVKVLPVVEKLEDWVYALLEGEPCRCCGVERLSRLLGTKYEKYMMAKRVPSVLESERGKVCENLSKGWLLGSTGLRRLLDLLCMERRGR